MPRLTAGAHKVEQPVEQDAYVVVRGRPQGCGRDQRLDQAKLVIRQCWPEPKSPTNTRSAGAHMMVSRQKTSCNAIRTPAISTSFQARHPLSNGL